MAAHHLRACPVRAGVLHATWNASTTNAGGALLTNLASYRVYFGTSDPPCPTSSFLAVPSTTSTPTPGTVISFTLTGLITEAVYFVQVTAVDATGNESPCSSLASGVARPDPADATPPTVTITSPVPDPTHSTGSNTLTLAGTASDDEGVIKVSWTDSQGASGTAIGTTNWTASGIVLQPGTNVLTVTARDAAGNAGTATLTVNYVLAPTITSISPTSVTAGDSAFTLVVAGANFVDSSEVQVNGAARTTSYVSPTQLTAIVLANDIAEPGIVQVTLVTPPPSGGISNTAPLNISPTIATASTMTNGSTITGFTTSSIGGLTTTGSTTTPNGASTTTTTGGSTTTAGTSTTTTSPATSSTATAWAAGQSYVDPSSSMTVVRVTDSTTAPGGSTGNSLASDSMFNADGTLLYLHHQNVGTFLYSADRGTGQVTQLGQLPATTPNGDALAYDGAPWDPTKPNALYAIVMDTTRRELWQLMLPLPAAMTLLHDFSSAVPTGGYPSSRVQVSSDGRYFVIAASTTGGPGTYDHVMVWDRQTGGSQVLQFPSWIRGLMLRSMVFDSSGAYALLETIDSSGRTDLVLVLVPSATTTTITPSPSTDTTPPSLSFSSPVSGATVAGTITVTVSMMDNIGVTRVQYYLDGALVTVYSPPVGSFTWDSVIVGNGSHTWTAVAYDAAGNTAQAAVTFTVQNGDTTPP